MKRFTDVELVQMAKNNSTEAYGELFRRHVRGVRIEVARVLFLKDDEEDVAQEAFMRAFQKLESLNSPYSFGGWVRQIARNIARNRNTRSPQFLPFNDSTSAEYHEGMKSDMDDTEERFTCIIKALSRLSPRLRETARLSYLADITNKQIAVRLRIPLGTVKSRLWDARSRIQKEVTKMNHTAKGNSYEGLVPEIQIRELTDETMSVKSKGPGLYFGSVLEPGHSEVCCFYDYPDGILTQTVRTQVMRELNVMDRKCLEVLIEHTDCEPPEPNVLDYFEPDDAGFYWIMRTVADGSYPQTNFMKEKSELFVSRFSLGEHENYAARAVELTIGSIIYGKCLAVFWSWENGTPAESFYTEDGRQVLHRRYVGAHAKDSGSYNYCQLEDGYCKEFRGVEYRLWYDTVICQNLENA